MRTKDVRKPPRASREDVGDGNIIRSNVLLFDTTLNCLIKLNQMVNLQWTTCVFSFFLYYFTHKMTNNFFIKFSSFHFFFLLCVNVNIIQGGKVQQGQI